MEDGLAGAVVEFISTHILAIVFGFVWLIAGILLQHAAERVVRARR